MSRTRTWSLLTALVVVLLLIAAWLLAIGPKRSEAADLRAQTRAQQEQSDSLRIRLGQLETKAAQLPQRVKEFEAVAARIPTAAELPDLIRALSDAAQRAGVTLTGLTPTPPEPLVLSPAPAAAPTATTGTTGSTPATSAATPAAAASSTLSQVRIGITVTGDYLSTAKFLNNLEQLDRAFLVTGFTVGTRAGAAGPGTELDVSISGSVFLTSARPGIGAAPATTPGAPAPAATAAPSAGPGTS